VVAKQLEAAALALCFRHNNLLPLIPLGREAKLMDFPLPSDKGKQILRILALKNRLMPAHLRKARVHNCIGIGKNSGYVGLGLGRSVALESYCCWRLQLGASVRTPR
jgi:hypothetical protein